MEVAPDAQPFPGSQLPFSSSYRLAEFAGKVALATSNNLTLSAFDPLHASKNDVVASAPLMSLAASSTENDINSIPIYPKNDPIFVSSFEFKYTFNEYQQWLADNAKVPILSVIIYLAFIRLGTKFMENRKPYNLKWLLFAWNTGLAIFSICGSVRALHDVIYLTSNFGFNLSVCKCYEHNVRGFWMFYFALSKVVELGDTVFLVLRKRPVIFLHWYHHISVLLFTWFACAQGASFGRYFICMNFIVHSFMYTYFAAQTLSIRPPKFVSMFITTLQILQMVGGIFVVHHAYREISSGNRCEVKQATMTNALLMYASYFVLFVNFFLEAYVFKKKSSSFKMMKDRPAQSPSINNNDLASKTAAMKATTTASSATSKLVHRNTSSLHSNDTNNNSNRLGVTNVCDMH